MAPPSTPSTLKLVCTTTSLRNVTIATESDDYYYEIVTPKWDPLNTQIRRLDSEAGIMSPVAEMKKQDEDSQYTGLRFIHPEKAETGFMNPDDFLTVNGPGKILGSFSGQNGKCYRWQEGKKSLELVPADDPEGKTLAHFYKHHRHLGVLRMSEKPYLEVDMELAGSMNTFIVSFLLAEGRRRQQA